MDGNEHECDFLFFRLLSIIVDHGSQDPKHSRMSLHAAQKKKSKWVPDATTSQTTMTESAIAMAPEITNHRPSTCTIRVWRDLTGAVGSTIGFLFLIYGLVVFAHYILIPQSQWCELLAYTAATGLALVAHWRAHYLDPGWIMSLKLSRQATDIFAIGHKHLATYIAKHGGGSGGKKSCCGGHAPDNKRSSSRTSHSQHGQHGHSHGTPDAPRPSDIVEWCWCSKCKDVKPQGTHHCMRCGQCVMRRDHHCPWIDNCIGILNQPYFLQFLFWTIVCCVWCGIRSTLLVYPCVFRIYSKSCQQNMQIATGTTLAYAGSDLQNATTGTSTETSPSVMSSADMLTVLINQEFCIVLVGTASVVAFAFTIIGLVTLMTQFNVIYHGTSVNDRGMNMPPLYMKFPSYNFYYSMKRTFANKGFLYWFLPSMALHSGLREQWLYAILNTHHQLQPFTSVHSS